MPHGLSTERVAAAADDGGDPHSSLLRGFMLPNADGEPPGSREKIIHPGIALLVVMDFGKPIISIGAQRPSVCRAAMPEAPVQEYGDSRWAKHEVRGGPYARQRSSVNSIPQAKSMNRRSKSQLRLSAPAPVTLHDRSSGWRRGPRLVGRHEDSLDGQPRSQNQLVRLVATSCQAELLGRCPRAYQIKPLTPSGARLVVSSRCHTALGASDLEVLPSRPT
jgi:hypothetical protein